MERKGTTANEVTAKAKPKRRRGPGEDPAVERTTPRTRRTGNTVLDSGPEREAADNGKVPRSRKPPNKKKKAKTANELMLEAWKYSWENRHRRLTKT